MTTAFDLQLARRLAAASKVAYGGKAEGGMQNAEWCAAFDTSLCHAIILHSADEIIIAFRGTANLQDFVTDARFDRYSFPDFPGTIHAGFGYSITDELITSIIKALSDLQGSKFEVRGSRLSRPIYLTGHSLGGAQAVLAAYRLLSEDIPIAGLYTFGQPRVGDGKFCRALNLKLETSNLKLFRVVHETDIVPRLPGVLLGYRHAGIEEFISGFSAPLSVYRITENPRLWFKLLSDAWDIWSARRRGPLAIMELLTDHHMDNYVNRLNLI